MPAARRTLTLVTMLLVSAAGWAQYEDVVRYEIEVTLDPKTHILNGSQRVRWTNTRGVPASELWWHLHLNAFAGDRSTFMRSRRDGPVPILGEIDGGWGWIRVSSLVDIDGVDLLPGLFFERPDDGNPGDFTVARLELPREVPPGAAVELDLEFEAQLPRIAAGTGYAGGYHMVARWFPKLAVFEGERGWSCHQSHAASRFVEDFGSYRVAINVPAGWVVGATGIEVEKETRDTDQRFVFSADRVLDFAWCAAPSTLMAVVEEDFEPGRDVPMVWLDRARTALGLGAADLELPPIHLRLLLPRSRLGLADRILRATRFGLAWYGLHYGAYPHPQLTVVASPPAAAGGVGYPTLVTTVSSRLFTVPPFSRLPLIEKTTIHAFGNQYFHDLLGSNEAGRTWLVDGLDDYAGISCMNAIAEDGLAGSVQTGGRWPWARVMVALTRKPLEIDLPSWSFPNTVSSGASTSSEIAVFLKTLEGLIGERAFATGMRTSVQRFRHRHPTDADLLAVFEEVSGLQLGWFFDQAVGGDIDVDWAVLGVENLKHAPPRGFRWNGDRWEQSTPDSGAEGPWTVEIDIARLGGFVGPVEVQLQFADSSEERRSWDGVRRRTRWRFSSARPVTGVVVDPDGVWALEDRRANNYWRTEPRVRTARRQLWWITDALQLLSLIHLPWS
jgi:hypothetical protein